MKMLSQKILSLTVAIAILCVSFIGASFGEEPNENQKPVSVFYNPKVREQSVLFRFLHGRLLIETLAVLMQENNLCNYCKIRENYSITFPNGSPDFLKELDISEAPSSDFWSFLGLWKKTDNKNCDLCELLNDLPFKDLRNKLFNKLNQLHKEEYDLLKEQDSKVAENNFC